MKLFVVITNKRTQWVSVDTTSFTVAFTGIQEPNMGERDAPKDTQNSNLFIEALVS